MMERLLFLGGLLTEKEIVSHNKVPFLGDIPVLGWLFRSHQSQMDKQNLLVFITPTIISGANQKDDMKNLLKKKLQERLDFIKKHTRGKDKVGESLKKLIPEAPSDESSSFFGAEDGIEDMEAVEEEKEEFVEVPNVVEEEQESTLVTPENPFPVEEIEEDPGIAPYDVITEPIEVEE